MPELSIRQTGGDVKRIIAYTVLGFGVWLAVTTGWAFISYVTGVPGPAAFTSGALAVGAEVVTAAELPHPFGAAQRFTARQMERSRRFVERVNGVPERAVHRLLDRLGLPHRFALADEAVAVRVRPHVHTRIHVRAPRIDAIAPQVAQEQARAAERLAAELERAAALAEIEAWQIDEASEDVAQELERLDLSNLRLELNAHLEALSEHLRHVERDQVEFDLSLRALMSDDFQREMELLRDRLEQLKEDLSDAEAPVVIEGEI